jgi:hypothetical protein
MSIEINNHLLRTKYLIDHSIETEAFDQAVASLLSTEMYFRRSLHRLMEYIAWIIYWVACPKKLSSLSVGIAQIQLRHWRDLGVISSLNPTPKNLRLITHPTTNYMACRKFLLVRGYAKDISIIDLAHIYTGSARRYYVTVLAKAQVMWGKSPNNSIHTDARSSRR